MLVVFRYICPLRAKKKNKNEGDEKDMFDKLKRMFRGEDAMGSIVEICLGTFGTWCNVKAVATAIDTLFCGGGGILKGGIVPMCNNLLTEIAKLIGA